MAKTSQSKDDGGEPLDFEASLQQLEVIVGQLEEGDLGLSESLVRYEDGMKHLKRCYELLQQAEQKIEVLAGVDAEGRPVTKPFSADSPGDGENASRKVESRRVQRHPSPPSNSSVDADIDDQGSLF